MKRELVENYSYIKIHILDLDGKENVTYEWGLGQISNNKAEAYSLLMGTRIICRNFE